MPRKYQGYAQSRGFNPLQAPDPTRRMEQQAQSTLRGMERVQDQSAQNQQNLISGLERKSRLEEENRNTLFGLDQENRKRVIEDQLRNMKRSVEDPSSTTTSTTVNNINALAVFSDSIGKLAVNIGKQKYESDVEEGKQLGYMVGLPTDSILEYERNESELYQAHDALTATAARLQKEGAPQELIDKIRGLSGAKRHGFYTSLVERAGSNYSSWVLNELSTNNTTVLRDKDGNEFTPVQSMQDPVKAAVALAELRKQFFKVHGFNSVNDALLNKYAYPQMLDADARLMGQIRRTYSITQSEESTQDTLQRFLTDKNLSRALNEISLTVDGQGAPRGMKGAWEVMQKYMTDNFDANLLTDDDITTIEGQVEPVSGQRFGERWRTRFALIREEVAAARRKNAADEDAELETQARSMENSLMTFFRDNPNESTDANIEAAQKDFFNKFQRKSEKLSTLQSSFSMDALSRERLSDQFQNLAEQNMLTVEMAMKAPWEVRTKWLPVAQNQEKARSQSGNYKNQLDAIENTVKNDPRVKVSPDGSTGGIATLVIGELQAKFNRKVAEYVGVGKPPAEASQLAVAEVMNEFATNSRYQIDGTGEFANFKKALPGAKATKAVNLKLRKIRDALAYGGKGSLDNKPGLIFDAAELRAIERSYGRPGFSMPPEATYWGSKLGINPLDVINRQRRAAGMPDLATPAALERIQQTISPELQSLLNRYQSYNRSVRALSSTKRFDPYQVPKNLGVVVQAAATSYGIDPAILAGLIETESNWKANARSSSGARGIAQIMPQYHPGVNVDDPIASINYAAKYLSGLQRQFGGDMRLALIAYNAGPGNVEKYRGPIPGDKESGSYYQKVITSAAKYGYGQAWMDPATMRGKFRTIEYLSGDPNHKSSYRADHGGSNYHDHIAFASKAERDAAIRKLTAAGIKVGSIDRPGDPGNHGRGLAIDIPGSQVPVGQEKELSRRVRSILGIS